MRRDQEISQGTPFGAYFGSSPVNPAFSTRVNVNEHKTFHKLWMIKLKEKTKATVSKFHSQHSSKNIGAWFILTMP